MWDTSPATLALDDTSVHVWFASLDQPTQDVRRLAQTLSEDEQARAARFHFERDKKHFIVSRAILRALLGHYLEIDPSQLVLDYGSHGKPALDNALNQGNLRFNLSHSCGTALYAVTRHREVGIDLEGIRPVPEVESIAEQFFSVSENAMLRLLPETEKLRAFFNCWTRKEAYIKAIGDGLSCPLDQFDVSLAPGEPARLLRIAGDPQRAARWTLQKLELDSDFVAALAFEGHGCRVAYWRWSAELVTA